MWAWYTHFWGASESRKQCAHVRQGLSISGPKSSAGWIVRSSSPTARQRGDCGFTTWIARGTQLQKWSAQRFQAASTVVKAAVRFTYLPIPSRFLWLRSVSRAAKSPQNLRQFRVRPTAALDWRNGHDLHTCPSFSLAKLCQAKLWNKQASGSSRPSLLPRLCIGRHNYCGLAVTSCYIHTNDMASVSLITWPPWAHAACIWQEP